MNLNEDLRRKFEHSTDEELQEFHAFLNKRQWDCDCTDIRVVYLKTDRLRGDPDWTADDEKDWADLVCARCLVDLYWMSLVDLEKTYRILRRRDLVLHHHRHHKSYHQ